MLEYNRLIFKKQNVTSNNKLVHPFMRIKKHLIFAYGTEPLAPPPLPSQNNKKKKKKLNHINYIEEIKNPRLVKNIQQTTSWPPSNRSSISLI